MKKILCISDQIDPVIYDKNIKTLYNDVDFILSAGDLPKEYLDFIQTSLEKPLFFVLGGHYLEKPATQSSGKKLEIDLGFKTDKIDNILIAGISGTKKQTNGKNQFTEKRMKKKLMAMIPKLILNKIKYGRYIDILLTHTPPYKQDTSDKIYSKNETATGFQCISKFIKKFKPKYVVHGNIHIYDNEKNRISYEDGYQLINAYSRYVLEFNNEENDKSVQVKNNPYA